MDKEKTGFGQGSQIRRFSSRVLGAPRLEINTFIKRIDEERNVSDKELRLANLARRRYASDEGL